MSARAVVLESFDSRPRLIDVALPEVGERQVLIRLRAASLNAFDWKVAAGVFKDLFTYRFPVTIGRDYAGVVERAGAAVSRVRAGDPVFGYVAAQELHRGSLADYLRCDEHECFVAKPESLSFEHAACLPLSAVVARRCVEAVSPGVDDRVLILGAPGGVGSYAIQLAAAAGARVIASGLAEDRDYLTALGAAEVLPPGAGMADAIRRRYPEGIQGLIDLVSYQPAFLAHTELLAAGGRAASTHRAVDPEQLTPRGITAENVTSAPDPRLLAQIGAAAAEGSLAIPVQHVYELGEACHGLDRLRHDHTRGKAVVKINDN